MKLLIALSVTMMLTPSLMPKATATVQETTKPSAAEQATLAVEGPIAKVVSRKKEIYVQGPDKKHEFYFKPDTRLTKGGEAVEFATLKEGMKVRVSYVKVGKRTDPVAVEIIQ